MRQKYELTGQEQKRFRRLKPIEGEAIKFWQMAAYTRGLDYQTIISTGRTFTALPIGHGKHWCYPMTLKCKRRPVYVEE
jgi:hypothetical protein